MQLAVLDGRLDVYVGKVDGPPVLTPPSRLGSRLEARATGTGRALLSEPNPEELDRRFEGVTLERLTPRTMAEPDGLHRELKPVRERGDAVDNEKDTAGTVVVRSSGDQIWRAVAALSVSAPTVGVSNEA